MSNGHAKFSPSAAKQWLACPGSWWVNQQTPQEESGEAAKEGTRAHELAELSLKKGVKPTTLIGHTLTCSIDGEKDTFEVTEEMARNVEVYTEHVRLLATLSDYQWIEERVTVPIPAERDLWGTADAVVFSRGFHLDVLDLKYGLNPVEAEDNPQIAAYILGALDLEPCRAHPPETVTGWIVQPRVSKEPLEWRIDDVPAFVDHWTGVFRGAIRACVQAAKRISTDGMKACGDAFEAGAHCRYCSAQLACDAFADLAIEQAAADFDAIDCHEGGKRAGEKTVLGTETAETLARRLALKEAVTNYYKRLTEHLTGRAESGEEVPGFKLVESLSNRHWAESDEEMAKKLRNQKLKQDEYMVSKLKTPAQIEKILKNEKFFKKYVTRTVKGRTIAPAKDRRPAVQPSTQTDFQPVEVDGFDISSL